MAFSDRKKHDDNLEATSVHGASFYGAVHNLSATIVGAGLMALPATLKLLGIVPGLAMIVLGALLTKASIDIILRFSRASKATSYSGLVGDTLGDKSRILLQACIVLNNFGILVVYMIIIGDVLSGSWSDGIHHWGVMEARFGQQWWTERSVLLLLTTIVILAILVRYKQVG